MDYLQYTAQKYSTPGADEDVLNLIINGLPSILCIKLIIYRKITIKEF